MDQGQLPCKLPVSVITIVVVMCPWSYGFNLNSDPKGLMLRTVKEEVVSSNLLSSKANVITSVLKRNARGRSDHLTASSGESLNIYFKWAVQIME